MVVAHVVLALTGATGTWHVDLAMPPAMWALLPLTFVIAVAFSLPALLALPERHRAQAAA